MKSLDRNKKKKVVLISHTPFHMYHLARELQVNNLLYKLITDYPQFKLRSYGIARNNVNHLLMFGIFAFFAKKTKKFIPIELSLKLNRFIHDCFSHLASHQLPKDYDFLIGLSSFCLDSVKESARRGILSAVDHGSNNLLFEKRQILLQSEYWELPATNELPPDWVIEKEKKEFDLANYIILGSEVAKKTFISEGYDESKLFVNYYGVNLDKFYKTPKQEEVFRIIQVGQIRLSKGVLTLIEAFNEAKIPNSELYLVGPLPSCNMLMDKINLLSGKNVFLTGPMNHTKLNSTFNMCNVSVLASVSDGFGIVTTQAMACGLPVIVSDNAGSSDIINHGVNGYVFPSGSSKALAKYLRILYENRALRLKMGDEAFASVSNLFTWTNYGKKASNFIKDIS